jgi:hypothetical protein
MARLLASDVIGLPENEAVYGLSYIEPEHAFLSELNITNEGGMQPGPGNEGTNPPQSAIGGSVEFRYEVLETTNVGGTVFPRRTVLRKYAPSTTSVAHGDVRESVVGRLIVDEIGEWSPSLGSNFVVSTPLVACDRRIPSLPKNLGLYKVFNDNWPTVTNPALVRLAQTYRAHDPARPPFLERRRAAVLFTIALISLLGLALGIASYRKHKQDQLVKE